MAKRQLSSDKDVQQILIEVVFKKGKSTHVKIGSNVEDDPWNRLGIMMEGFGVMHALLKSRGYKNKKGKTLKQYFHDYLDKVMDDYPRVMTVVPGGTDEEKKL